MRIRKRRKQRKIIIISSLTLLFIMTVGYAAFQTNINITAKGNILEKGITINELKNKVTTSGDGLYKDTYETNRYIYRGANPDNYITFNNETWRIIAIESDNTLKIIKKDSIGTMPYDPGYETSITGITEVNSMEGTRYTSNDTDYCYYSSSTTSYYGCNVWGSKTTMLDANGNNITKMPKQVGNSTYNLPDKEAYINTYLNENYYNTLNENAKAKIITQIWDVGIIDIKSGQNLETDIVQESAYKWNGKIGLINVTDYVNSNSNTQLCGNLYMNTSNENNYTICKTTTWLYKINRLGIMSALSNLNSRGIFVRTPSGNITSYYAMENIEIYPVVYLTSNIIIKGEGTETNPYIIN